MSTLDPQPGEPLTAREQEILGYVLAGRSQQEIADALGIVLKTVNVHVRHIAVKRGARGAYGLLLQEIARLRN